MTPEIVQRSFTNDQAVFDEVFFGNKYKLKGDREKIDGGKIIVDIGAHGGFFTFLSVTLGAKKVYAFEPFIDNFNIFLKNCYNPNFLGKVTPYQLGVSPQESFIGRFDVPEFVDNIYFDLAKIGLSTKENIGHYPCRCETLDTILTDYCFDEKIDLLKINIGYSEREILLGSSVLVKNVNSVCGEISANDIQLLEFKRQMGIQGFINFWSTTPNDKERVLFKMSKTSLSDNFIE